MISGEKIELRFPNLNDLEQIFFWENNDELGMINWNKEKIKEDEIFIWLSSLKNDLFVEKQLRYIIQEKVEKCVLGSIDLFEFDETMNSIGIGVVVNPPYRKKGIATDSLTLLINHCFKNLGIKKIWCNIHEKNDSSLRLFQKLGFEIIHKRHDSYLMHEVLFLQLDLSSWK